MNLAKFIQSYSIPNVISITRLLVAIYLYKYIDFLTINYVLLILYVALIGLSDALDGYLARRYDSVTKFGTIIDPFVDRTVFILLLLWFRPILSEFFFWGIIVRDVAVLLGSILILKKENTINVSNLGKFTTVFLFITICFSILSTNINIGVFTHYLSYFAVILYYYVAFEYLYKQVLFSE